MRPPFLRVLPASSIVGALQRTNGHRPWRPSSLIALVREAIGQRLARAAEAAPQRFGLARRS